MFRDGYHRIRSPGTNGGSEGKTKSAVRGIRSPGTNGVPREEPRVRFVEYGHQEPTGLRGENRGCGSWNTVTRNQRGSEGRTEGAVRGIRSPGTNGAPRGEPRVRFVEYGHQEPTGFRGKNQKCGSWNTVTRNQRGSEGKTKGAVRGIRSSGTNGAPRGELRVRFVEYGHQEPTGAPRGELRVRFVEYGHQEPTGLQEKNRGCD